MRKSTLLTNVKLVEGIIINLAQGYLEKQRIYFIVLDAKMEIFLKDN